MLSVIIVSWNTCNLLRSCLQSLYQHPPETPLEVIVVDNASTDGSAEMVRAEFPQVHLIASDKNFGYARGNNLGFAVASGEWLLTLNPDTEVFEDTLNEAIHVLKNYPQAGALGARQIGLDGWVQSSIRGFPGVLGILGDITGLGKRMPGSMLDSYRLSSFDYETEQIAPQPMGTFILFRREALEAVGDPKAPFDEGFPIFFNEVDLLYRLKQRGWDCVYAPSVRLRHYGGESTKQVRKSMIWESHRSLARFMRKHYRTVWNAAGIALVSALLSVSAFFRAKGYDAGFRP
ncbi:MAG: glycosyltransferase family 2 protein [Armatimonadetes bacterium]|nr:glycosyltransferase family 2 protein [Armatimonadota bacterium]